MTSTHIKDELNKALRESRNALFERIRLRETDDYIISVQSIKAIKFALAELEEQEKDERKAKKSVAKKEIQYSDEFLYSWAMFPTNFGGKVSRPKAFAEFKKLNPDKALRKHMIDMLSRQISEKEYAKSRNEFFPEFKDVERWIRDRRWEDDPVVIDTPECAAMTTLTDTSWADGIAVSEKDLKTIESKVNCTHEYYVYETHGRCCHDCGKVMVDFCD